MICWDRFWSSLSVSDDKNTAIWDCNDFFTGMYLPNYEEDNTKVGEEEEEDGEGRGGKGRRHYTLQTMLTIR